MGHPKMANKPANKSTVSSVKIDANSESVSFELSVFAALLEPILGAAYSLPDRAFALLEVDRENQLRVSLSPKAGGDAKASRRWEKPFGLSWDPRRCVGPSPSSISRSGVRHRAGSFGQRPSPAPAADALRPISYPTSSAGNRAAHRRGRGRNQDLNEKNPKDPKNIAATWEEKQSARTAGASAKGSGPRKGRSAA